MREKKKKTVFTVLSKTDHFLANYAALLAKSMSLDLVLYLDSTKIYSDVFTMSQKIRENLEIKITISQKKANMFSWLTSISDIAKEENAEIVILNLCKEKVGFFGESIWDKAQKLNMPIILLPDNYMFDEFKNIVISADSSMKIQKTGVVIRLAKCFDSEIHIFKENVENTVEQNKIEIISRNISMFLKENKINFIVKKARNTKKQLKFDMQAFTINS
ncbi:MAG: hypothetical protein EOM23_02300 [Candidatus Moranbacteria bacterium]|nr:hypothetical protein [Candidatus Moranbacteria bacterium]